MIGAVAAAPSAGWGQEPAARPSPDSIMATAREVMAAAYYAALITVDSTGQPRARVMEPFPPEDDMTVWFGTNPKSRKVAHIRGDPRVTLYYFDAGGLGYVTITGTARLVNDAAEKAVHWRQSWEAFYHDRDESYLLIEVRPLRLEVVSVKHGLAGDPVTWTPDGVTLDRE